MKRKRLVILVAVFVFILVCLLYVNWHQIFPSQQMKELRQLEASLNLPESKFRSEVDKGTSKDLWGSTGYERHISLSFDDVAILDQLKTKLLQSSWQEGQQDSTSGNTSYFSFVRGVGSETQCISGYTGPADSNGIVLSISLKASGEYGCDPIN